MTKLTTIIMRLVLLSAVLVEMSPVCAQLRNIIINAESEEGKLLQQAGEQTDSAKKIEMLEQFLSKFGAHEAVGFVHLQLQSEYLKVNNFDKSIENGEKAQAKAPDDLEIAHFLVKGWEGKGDAERLAAAVDKAHALAQKIKSVPKPADGDEVEAWKRNVDFATQVDQFNEHALYSTALKQTAPQAKVLLLDALRKGFPGGQFDKTLDAQYVLAYQQLGQADKMAQAAEAALAGDPNNEAYLYLAGEGNLDPAKGKVEQSAAYAQKIIQLLPGKAKPANMSDDDWTKHKETYTGLAYSLMGRSLANQGQYAAAQKELLTAATALKNNNEALSPVMFYLGFCAAKLERHREAIKYLSEAAKVPGPFQAAAADMLQKVKAALAGRK